MAHQLFRFTTPHQEPSTDEKFRSLRTVINLRIVYYKRNLKTTFLIMNKPITVRQASVSDSHNIAQFNVKMAWETEEKKLDKEIISTGVESLFQKPEYGFYMVAEADGEVVASLMITKEWSDWRNGLFWWIQSVYVKPEFRRQGIYRSMYETILKLATNHTDVCGCRLYVEKENTRAQKTYKALGMSETHYKMYEEVFSE